MSYLAAWTILLIYLGFAFSTFRQAIKSLVKRLGDWTVGFLLLPYLLAVNFHTSWQDLLRMTLFIALPTLLLRFHTRGTRPLNPFQILAVLALWIPIEPRLFILILDLILPGVDLQQMLAGSYLLPNVEANLFSEVSLPIPTLIAVSLALYLFIIRHPLKGIGFTFHFTGSDVKLSIMGLLIYGLIGLPIGLLLGFLRFDPTPSSLMNFIGGSWADIY